MKVYIGCVKQYQNDQTLYDFKKAHLENQILRLHYLLARWDPGKLLISISLYQYRIVTGNAIDYYNRSLLVRHGDRHSSSLSLDRKKFKQNRNKVEVLEERCLLAVLNDYSNNYSHNISQITSKFWFYIHGNSTIACCSLQRFRYFKLPKSKLNERNTSFFSKSNTQKTQSVCSSQKQNEVWK